MKIRLGFISNSSSSSFICIVAKIKKDSEVVRQTKVGTDSWVLTGKELLDHDFVEKPFGWEFRYSFRYSGNTLKVADCDWCGVEVNLKLSEIDPNAEYLIIKSYGGAGDDDYDFGATEDNWDLDYDVDWSDFIETPIIDKLIDDGLIEVIESGYGAGRNG